MAKGTAVAIDGLHHGRRLVDCLHVSVGHLEVTAHRHDGVDTHDVVIGEAGEGDS